MTLTLTLREAPQATVDAGDLRPDALRGLDRDEIRALPLRHGNRAARVADFFEVEGDAADADVHVVGDLRRFERFGAGMAAGRLTLAGPVGPAVAAGMTGGACEVEGHADAYAGAAMRGGLLLVRGSAGERLGAALPGERAGMSGGELIVHGDAGDEAGAGMRRGLVAIGGRAGDGTGSQLLAGTVIALGGVGRHPGTGMRRGSVVAPNPVVPPVGFRFACRFRPPALRLQLARLRRLGLPMHGVRDEPQCARWSGDAFELDRGELLVIEEER